MASAKTWAVKVTDHPGSSGRAIAEEPDWGAGHQHRVGYVNSSNRVPGLTSDDGDYRAAVEHARQAREELQLEVSTGKLVNFRDLIESQTDFHLRHPENKSRGWRFVLNVSEDWVKNEEDWPSNVKRRKEEAEKKNEEEEKQGKGSGKASQGDQGQGQDRDDAVQPQPEHEWRRGTDKDKHNSAYATARDDDSVEDAGNAQKHKTKDEGQQDEDESDGQPLRDKYSPQELALLKALVHEKNYISRLEENDGSGSGSADSLRSYGDASKPDVISIDEQDQFSPDNWIPRSPHLIRLTGKHPLNAEPDLGDLYECGLITPNELHYVRNHGAVPRLLWEFHELRVEHSDGFKVYSMEDLTSFNAINIAVALACDGNRRKELNLIKKSKGFNWGPGAISCAYWKGPLLRDVLLDAGVPEMLALTRAPKNRDNSHGNCDSNSESKSKSRYWVNFEGSDELSEGRYATSIPFDYAMALHNDVMLAYAMNGSPLPPDHGYPLRLIIPGYVGGRCVKWLRRIWISAEENDSHYHIWDNRVLPAFVTEMDGPFAKALFKHPDTACNEQNLNSIIVKPGHKETLALSDVRKGKHYRITGLAYDGGGHEVQRVEVSLDGGGTWLYCIREFPRAPVRHGNKFWTWVHWHVDVDMFHLLEATSITVRCFNVFKNTQPQTPSWNIMGMMNNCWYVVKLQKTYVEESDVPRIRFLHPTEPGQGEGGWMEPSVENKIAEVTQAAGAPEKQFTREEIEKHSTPDDCWIVVDGKVYDATSVLSWHPGGSASILGHAGKVHQETTDDFSSIHDDFASQKLKECAIGVVTEKAANYIKKNAEAEAKEGASSSSAKADEKVLLQKHRWVPVKLVSRQDISDDSRMYTFELPADKPYLGLGTCQHVLIGFHLLDKMLIRSYTPTRPLLPKPKSHKDHVDGVDRSLEDGSGTFDLTVKTYFPDENQPGGAMSNILDCIPIGEEVEVRGPTGDIVYNSHGRFTIEGKQRRFQRVSLVLGGSGVTPGYSLIARILLTAGDDTAIRVVNANKAEADILLRDELQRFQDDSAGQLLIAHVLSHPSDDGGWEGLTGHVDEDKIKQHLFPPDKDSVVFLCGPPPMIQKAALPALKDWGYVEDENMFGF